MSIEKVVDYESKLDIALVEAGIDYSCRDILGKGYTFGCKDSELPIVGTISSVTMTRRGHVELTVSPVFIEYEPVRCLTYINEEGGWCVVLKSNIHSSPRYVSADRFYIHE